MMNYLKNWSNKKLKFLALISISVATMVAMMGMDIAHGVLTALNHLGVVVGIEEFAGC